MAKFAAISRRNMLFTAGGGISGLALANLLGQEGLLAAPLGVKSGFAADGFSQRRLVGTLRPRIGKSEPSVIRRHLRSSWRPERGRLQLEQRLPAGGLSRPRFSPHRRPDSRSAPARR